MTQSSQETTNTHRGQEAAAPRSHCTAEEGVKSITGKAGTMGEVYPRQRHGATVPSDPSVVLPLTASAAGASNMLTGPLTARMSMKNSCGLL